ncbi:UNVERIFIED_CONTAM: hypothetical protein FKN15_071207 [Acipenser sinensis]
MLGKTIETSAGHLRPEGPNGSGPGVFGQTAGPTPCLGPDSAANKYPGSDPALLVVALDASETDLAIADEDQHEISIRAPGMCTSRAGRSVFRTQTALPHLQPFPVFPNFLEEVRSSSNHLASAPSVVKRSALLASLEGAGALGLEEYPTVARP